MNPTHPDRRRPVCPSTRVDQRSAVLRIFPALLVACTLAVPTASAQESSLFAVDNIPPGPTTAIPSIIPGQRLPIGSQPSGLMGVSWTYQPAAPLRTFRIHDIVTIRVDEITRMMAEGESEKRRTTVFQAVLSDWIKLGRNGVVPDPQELGDPTVSSLSRDDARNEASIESRESLSFNIAAEVVDIRPNGNLLLEAKKTFRVNDNLWETSLSGTCRAQDIAPDNVVLSRDLLDIEINKQDRGSLRDGYSQGWFQRWFDRLKPF